MTHHDAAPLAEIKQAGIEKLRSMSHYGECRALDASAARPGRLQSWLSVNAAQQSLSRFPPTCCEAILEVKPRRIFSGLVVDSMSNMLSRNDVTGAPTFSPDTFQIATAACEGFTSSQDVF